MKKREKGLVILFMLAVVCVVCIAVHRKNIVSNSQEKSNISKDQGKGNLLDTKEKRDIPITERQEDNWQNHLSEIDEDAEMNPNHSPKMVQKEDDDAIAISSEDKKYTVFVRREERQVLYIYNADEKRLDQINLTPNLATDIMTLEWFDQNRVAVWSHVNPSLGCLDIYDVNSLEKVVEKYCSIFSWSDDIDTLIYVEPAPHFSSDLGEEKVLNIDDEILYQTNKNEYIFLMDKNENEDIAIVVDKRNFNYEIQSTDMVILNKKGKKYKVKEKIHLEKGAGREMNWINHKEISYSTRSGETYKVKKVSK